MKSDAYNHVKNDQAPKKFYFQLIQENKLNDNN